MGQVLLHALRLLRRPLVLLALLLLAGGGAALVALPGFDTPGYELSLALSLATGLLGGGVGVAAARQERALVQGHGERPAGVPRLDSALLSVLRATLSAFLLLCAALLVPLAASVVHAALGTACSPFALLGFYPLLTLPSALLAAAVGVLCGLLARRVGVALGLYALVVLASLAVTVWPVLAGPQVFAFNPFLGWVPGPLYDEALEVTPALLWFRLETVLLALLAWLLAAACLDLRTGEVGRPRLRPGAWLLLGACVAGVVALEQRAPQLGLRMSEESLAEALGGRRETEHFVLVYGRGKPREELERFARDLEFRYAQLHDYLGHAPEGRITVWLYRSDAEKRRLVGAGRTQFAKPWRRELHVSDRAFPHASLKHELAHVMLGPSGAQPFAVTARLGVWPVMGIIEGLAVAADAPVQGELTLHEWAAGMRREKLAPDIRLLLGPEGFYASAPARAYTLAGSFLRFLGDTYGREKLLRLYRDADFQAAYGRPLDALASEWERHLDALPLDAAALARAFARFRESSLFVRPCAREVALLEEAAHQALASDPDEALRLYRRCGELQPEEPDYALGQARALVRLDRHRDADATLATLAPRVAGRAQLEAEVALARADVALLSGALDEARAHLERVLTLAPTPALVRTALVKRAALGSDTLRTPVRDYFSAEREELRLWRLSRALVHAPHEPLLHYLLGRRLQETGAPAEALPHLSQALSGELPDPVRQEAVRLRLRAAYLAGDCATVRSEAGALPDWGPALAEEAREWVARCDFEEKAYAGALVPGGEFR